MLSRFVLKQFDLGLTKASSRAVVRERYAPLRQQVPIIYLLGLINLSALELATTGKLSLGLNLPTFILVCGLLRITQWFGAASIVSHDVMMPRMKQTVWFAAIVCSRCAHAAFSFSRLAMSPRECPARI